MKTSQSGSLFTYLSQGTYINLMSLMGRKCWLKGGKIYNNNDFVFFINNNFGNF